MPGNDLRLLALDGGGVRGLSALMILEQLMEAVNPDTMAVCGERADSSA
jgi:patatin-like phospholipase/acyl hydrolase